MDFPIFSGAAEIDFYGGFHYHGARRMERRLFSVQKMGCTLCGYIYDPDLGDSEHDIVQGVDFDDLPESWACPECGAEKDQFDLA